MVNNSGELWRISQKMKEQLKQIQEENKKKFGKFSQTQASGALYDEFQKYKEMVEKIKKSRRDIKF